MDEKEDDRTYVWARLKRDGSLFVPSERRRGGDDDVAASSSPDNKRNRGGGGGCFGVDDFWGWTPGYYSRSSGGGGEGEEGDVRHRLTLLDEDDEDDDDDDRRRQRRERVLPGIAISRLMECGYVVPANAWEVRDFFHGYDDDEDGYDNDHHHNRDDDHDDDDDDRGSSRRRRSSSEKGGGTAGSTPPHDLVDLAHLHEPSVVQALRRRYHRRRRRRRRSGDGPPPASSVGMRRKGRGRGGGKAVGKETTTTTMIMRDNGIYTDTGPILLAVNPFRRDDTGELYGDAAVDAYRNAGERGWLEGRGGTMAGVGGVGGGGIDIESDDDDDDGDDEGGSSSSSSYPLPPHVYAIADRAYRTMMTTMHHSSSSTDDASAARSSYASSSSTSNNNNDKRYDNNNNNNNKADQSILVSGESGAGKTVSTKLLMAYLSKLSEARNVGGDADVATMARSDDDDDDDDVGGVLSIERRVLESNPIMESFGNARTVRNDNSSRFGKYIEMKFVSSSSSSSSSRSVGGGSVVPCATLVGASVETYLLEKVRLVHQSPGERNYHIFYELLSMKYDDDDDDGEDDDIDVGGGSASERRETTLEGLGLLEYDVEDFRMTNASGTFDRRDGVSDAETFRQTKRSMAMMGFAPSDVRDVLRVVSALLHASNLTFVAREECCALDENNAHLTHVVDLLGITTEGLNSALCYYEITVGGGGTPGAAGGRRKSIGGGETQYKRVLSQEQAEKGVEALIKATYAALFSYLVSRINASVANAGGDHVVKGVEGTNASRGRGGKKTRCDSKRMASIGILDIFGFESFQTNSFEQLCINYCNEALQQQFNRFVLRNEQEEYDREGIPWSFIEFPENQDVLDLIDFRGGSGILNILHDQCRTPGASDKSFSSHVYEKCSSHPRFVADSRHVAEQTFAIHHYAGLVEYNAEGFLEKNRDELPKSGSDLLLGSTDNFVRCLANILRPTPAKGQQTMSPRIGASQRPTVGIQFSSQLQSLRRKIDDTSPHYIRCLKPNNLLVPDHFDVALIANQLRCAGVIEAVKVSRLGYPQRFSHNRFIARYKMLGGKQRNDKLSKTTSVSLVKALANSITQQLIDQSDLGIQVGKTKVFFRRQAFDLLEKFRRERITSATLILQKTTRKYICQKHFTKAILSSITIQSFIRKALAKKVVMGMRQQHNSIIIQRSLRKYAAKKLLSSAKIVALWCQSHFRGLVGRRFYNKLNLKRKAVLIQAQWRRYLALKSFKRQINAVVIIQSAKRCYVARAGLKARKLEIRDINKLRIETKALRDELKKMKDETKMDQVSQFDNSEKDTEIRSLRVALDQLSKEKEVAENKLEVANTMMKTLEAERNSAAQDRDDLKQVNIIIQSELNSREKELRCIKEDVKNSNTVLEEKSNVNETHANIDSTVETQIFGLMTKLRCLEEINVALQRDNDQLQHDNSILSSKTTVLAESIKETMKDVKEPMRRWGETYAYQKDTSVAATDCTSFTVDMDTVEDETARLREENQVLRKQLELLRFNGVFDDVQYDDQQYDESIDCGSVSSETTVLELVMNHIYLDVETVTEDGMIKTRDESESRTVKLQSELDELKVEMKQRNRISRYDVDDMTRINRSLRADLEAMTAEKIANEEEFKMKYDELSNDIEKFAETFATQYEELQHLEIQTKKLQSENARLKASDEDKLRIIGELKQRLEESAFVSEH